MPDSRILLLESDPVAGERITTVLEPLGHPCTVVTDPIEAIRRAAEHQLVIIDIVTDGDAVRVVRELRTTPEAAVVPVLCICQSDDVEERIRFLEAGADDVVVKPFDARELEARVDALQLRFQRSSLLGGGAVDRTPTTVTGHRIVAVYSPKGGVGTTTMAVNLACAFAAKRTGGVALLDLDLQFGQVATHLNMTPRQTLIDVVHDELALRDPDALRTVLAAHSSGVLVLPSPQTPGSSSDGTDPAITPEVVSTLVSTLARAVEVVVVDAGSALDGRTRAVLGLADAVVMPVTPEFPALKAVHALMDHLGQDGTLGPKTIFVLNWMFAREILHLRDIEDALGTKIALEVPYDPFLYLKAVNEGVPVVVGAPRTKPAERLERLAGIVAGESAPGAAPERKSGGFKLFGRG